MPNLIDDNKVRSLSFKAMASPCFLHIPTCEIERLGEKTIDLIFSTVVGEVSRIEKKYSRYDDNSYLAVINAGQWLELDEETLALINYADVAFHISDGLFDISSGVLRTLWDFKQQQLPDSQRLEKTLPLIGWQKILRDGNKIKVPAGMQLDFGGFGKEYAVDQCIDICRDAGLKRVLVDLGGDISALGDTGDSPWLIGIRHPQKPNEAIATIKLYAGGLATSGNYERFFIKDGKHYCHILNPHNAMPVDYWASVSCIADKCLIAGSLATITMLKEQAGKAWLQEQQQPFLLIDKAMNIIRQ